MRPGRHELERVEEVRAALAAHPLCPPDVLLVGAQPDGRTGPDTVEQLVGAARGVPVILIGRHGYEEDVAAMTVGAVDYLPEDRLSALLLERSIRHAVSRKRLERTIESGKRAWEYTFDAIPDPVAIVDIHYRLLRVNRTLAARLGKEPKDLVGCTCFETVHDLTCPLSSCPQAQLLRDEREHSVAVHESSLGGDFLFSVSPFRDEEGRLIGSIHVARDITARKRAEDALAARNEALQEAVQRRTKELAEKVQRLEEATTTLRFVLRQKQEDAKSHEEEVCLNLRKLIAPSLERIKRRLVDSAQQQELASLQARVERVTSSFGHKLVGRLRDLTPMEAQVATLVAEGKTSKEIAHALGVSENTGKFHRLNLRKKLGIRGEKKNLRILLSWRGKE